MYKTLFFWIHNYHQFQFKYYSKYDHNPREMSKRMMTKAKVWLNLKFVY